MILGEVPQPLVDVGTLAGIFTAISVATAVLWKTAPVRWLREKISESLGDWLKVKFTEATEILIEPLKQSQAVMKDDLNEIKKVVQHHLGQNGDTPQLHVRFTKVEKKVDQIVEEQSVVRGELHSDDSIDARKLRSVVESIDAHVEHISDDTVQIRHDLEDDLSTSPYENE